MLYSKSYLTPFVTYEDLFAYLLLREKAHKLEVVQEKHYLSWQWPQRVLSSVFSEGTANEEGTPTATQRKLRRVKDH